MSQLVAKLMLAILMLPSAALLYGLGILIGFDIASYSRENLVFTTVGVLVMLYIVGFWLLLWHRSIRWTKQRMVLTIAATGGAVALGLICGAVGSSVAMEASFGIFLASVVTIIAWLMLTTLAWRETNAERIERVRASSTQAVSCLVCGYNLTGLNHTACPECGARPTIEQLIAGQPSRADDELTGSAAS